MEYKLIHTDTRDGQGDQRYYLLDNPIKYKTWDKDDYIEHTTNIICCSHSIVCNEALLFAGGYDDNNELEIKSFNELAGAFNAMQNDEELINQLLTRI